MMQHIPLILLQTKISAKVPCTIMWDAFKAVEHLINQTGKKKLPSLKKLVILSEKKI
jgi:hypothetical protein